MGAGSHSKISRKLPLGELLKMTCTPNDPAQPGKNFIQNNRKLALIISKIVKVSPSGDTLISPGSIPERVIIQWSFPYHIHR